MIKRILLFTLVSVLILSFNSICIFAEANNASNEPVELFDFSIEDSIFEPDDTNKFYSWKSSGLLLRPTGTNEGKIVFSYNQEHKALQMDFNDDMATNGSCLWFSFSEAHEISAEKSYYLVFRYKYNGKATSGFLSPNQLLAGYSSVNIWSGSNSGGRVLKTLNAAGMPTISDGEWLVTFVRVSWQDRISEYDADKANIRIIRTSLVDTMSNDSVLLKSVALFEDSAGLSTMQVVDENAIKGLRSTAPVYFSMKDSFESADKVSFNIDEEYVKSIAYYEKADAEWKKTDAPKADGTYRIEVALKDGYYFESSWLGKSEDVDKGILLYEFTVGEVQKETEAPSKTEEVQKKTEKPNNGSNDNTDDNKGSKGLIVFIIIAAIVVAAVVVFIVIRKKQGKQV